MWDFLASANGDLNIIGMLPTAKGNGVPGGHPVICGNDVVPHGPHVD
jgi:hypothetical protein